LYWDDLDKIKFLGLLSTSSLILRTCFHPLALMKTRIQTEEKYSKSIFKMSKQVYINEGIRRGFYRGYSISICALLFEPLFPIIFETTRNFLKNNRPHYISISRWDTFTSSTSPGIAVLIQQTFLGMF
jgi:hypothetical protein